MNSNKLKSLAKSLDHTQNTYYYEDPFIDGFKEAFKLIDENLSKELSKLEQFPFMGERIMTLKLYKKKIQSYLEEMEIPYD